MRSDESVEEEMIEITWSEGSKSESDRVMSVTCFEEKISYKQLAKLFVRLCKNEQVITNEIPHYTKGSTMLRAYFESIASKNWVLVPNEKIDEELNLLYLSLFRDINWRFEK